MKGFFKKAFKVIAIFSFVTVTFYIIVFIQLKGTFEYQPNILSYEHLVFDIAESVVFNFCGILRIYLGLKFIKKVMGKELLIYQKALAGAVFFVVGYLSSRVGPAFYIGMICNTAGDYLLDFIIKAYGAENELTGNMELIFCLMMLCISSIVFAFMCYDAGEKIYIKHKNKDEELEGAEEE